MSWKNIIVLLIITHVYLFFGSLLFYYVERAGEDKRLEEAARISREFLGKFDCIDNHSLGNFISTVRILKELGVPIEHALNMTSETRQWNLKGACSFVCALATTIGYGDIVPRTVTGRVCCMFFGLIAIPLLLVILTKISAKMICFNCSCRRASCRIMKGHRHSVHVANCLLVVTGIIMLLIIPTFSFSWLEDWTFLESAYFVFTTISTVGFGDFVVDGKKSNFAVIYTTLGPVWLVFGLAWFSAIASDISDGISQKVDIVMEKHGRPQVSEVSRISNSVESLDGPRKEKY